MALTLFAPRGIGRPHLKVLIWKSSRHWTPSFGSPHLEVLEALDAHDAAPSAHHLRATCTPQASSLLLLIEPCDDLGLLLAPFEPLAMRRFHCPIDLRFSAAEAAAVSRQLRPQHLLLPPPPELPFTVAMGEPDAATAGALPAPAVGTPAWTTVLPSAAMGEEAAGAAAPTALMGPTATEPAEVAANVPVLYRFRPLVLRQAGTCAAEVSVLRPLEPFAVRLKRRLECAVAATLPPLRDVTAGVKAARLSAELSAQQGQLRITPTVTETAAPVCRAVT